MTGTIDRFKDALKARLEETEDVWLAVGQDSQTNYHYIDWSELNKAIDEFAAEFQRPPGAEVGRR